MYFSNKYFKEKDCISNLNVYKRKNISKLYKIYILNKDYSVHKLLMYNKKGLYPL